MNNSYFYKWSLPIIGKNEMLSLHVQRLFIVANIYIQLIESAFLIVCHCQCRWAFLHLRGGGGGDEVTSFVGRL